MSVQALSWVFDHSPTVGLQRLVMLSIANHASDVDFEAYPSIETIARESGTTPAVAKRTVSMLVQNGSLLRTVNGAPDERIRRDKRPNLYRIVRGTSTVTPVAEPGAPVVTPDTVNSPITGGTPSAPKPSVESSTELLGAVDGTVEKKPRARNVIWDALVEVTGQSPTTASSTAHFGKIVRELKAVDATPDEIRRRAEIYRRRFPGAELTPQALSKHWDGCAAAPTAVKNRERFW